MRSLHASTYFDPLIETHVHKTGVKTVCHRAETVQFPEALYRQTPPIWGRGFVCLVKLTTIECCAPRHRRASIQQTAPAEYGPSHCTSSVPTDLLNPLGALYPGADIFSEATAN